MSALAPQAGPQQMQTPAPAGPSGGPPIGALLAAAAAGVPHTITARPRQAPSTRSGDAAFKTALTKAIDDLHRLAAIADDPQDRQDVLKCLTALNGIQASELKERDAAMGGKLSPRLMRKAY